jgi:uncharacterized protein Yka (UPF0111/DUF47 family)
MRAFSQLRRMLDTRKDLKRKIEAMEKKYDENFQIVLEAIKQLFDEEEKPKNIYPVKFAPQIFNCGDWIYYIIKTETYGKRPKK